MDSGYYRAFMIWGWGVPIPDLKLPNGFSKALQENVTAAMNYSKTNGGEGDILWSHGHFDFDPLDPAQSGDNSILPFMLNIAQTVYSDPGDYQEEMDTMGRRLSEAEVRRQLSEDEPRWTDHVVFEPAFPHLDVSGCNQAGWSYFIVWVAMETPNHWHRQEFWDLMHEDRVSPIMAYPPPEVTGRRLEESFVAEACSDHLFIWSKRIHPAPSPPPPPPPPDAGVKEREYTVAGSTVAIMGFAAVFLFAIYGARWTSPKPKCTATPSGPLGGGFVVLAGGGGGLHDDYHRQQEVCPRRGPSELLYDDDRREVRFETGKDV